MDENNLTKNNDMNEEEDWRLLGWGEDSYLQGITLIKQPYRPDLCDPDNDHDHCEFCSNKFGKAPDDLKEGYSTEDGYSWICPTCFEDFKDRFKWKVIHRFSLKYIIYQFKRKAIQKKNAA